ncbi:hypothetical protein D6817_02220 [Candidatus Pacearchaeota archaeon]|nr:MAG: hypothetical protein D6817_02220 [Candidatus Pacearchaeota archaeon]
MSVEYVRVSPTERAFGKKNLLYSQLEILKLIESFQRFKELRTEEVKLKMELKQKAEQAENLLAELDKKLPETKHTPAPIAKKKGKGKAKVSHKPSLREEMEEIRRKLAMLKREGLV